MLRTISSFGNFGATYHPSLAAFPFLYPNGWPTYCRKMTRRALCLQSNTTPRVILRSIARHGNGIFRVFNLDFLEIHKIISTTYIFYKSNTFRWCHRSMERSKFIGCTCSVLSRLRFFPALPGAARCALASPTRLVERFACRVIPRRGWFCDRLPDIVIIFFGSSTSISWNAHNIFDNQECSGVEYV